MRILLATLLLSLSLPVFAQDAAPVQDDACGRASLEAMEKAAPEKDPAMQAKMDRLHASLRQGYEQCIATLNRRQAREEAMGMKTFRAATAPVAPGVVSKIVAADEKIAACSVVASNGAACVKKMSEKAGIGGAPDEVVFANACINPIEISVLYNDQSRGMATVKPGTSATLLCNGCGGVKSTESVCR